MTDQDGIISDQAQTIERLERELAELEAQCAAMREALEWYSCGGLGDCLAQKMKDGSCVKAASGAVCGDVAFRALSPDAGAKLLRVVEAIDEWSHIRETAEATTRIDAERKILKALAAWRGE